MTTTITLLKAYYVSVYDLRSYLSRLLDWPVDEHGEVINCLVQSTDSDAYKSLLNNSYVTSQTADCFNGSRRFRPYSPLVYMREIIDRAQEKLFSNAKGRPSNVITAGYRLSSKNGENGKCGGGRTGITNYFVNTMITALQAPEWEKILQRIGDDTMFHLLTEMSIFVPLPNDCLCQITGEPIVHLKRPDSWIPNPLAATGDPLPSNLKRQASDVHPDERPTKRLRNNHEWQSKTLNPGKTPGTDRASQIRTPADIPIVRMRVFYSRPQYIPHTTSILVGLPPKHILNRIIPSYMCKSKTPRPYISPSPVKQMEDARHLAKYIFPRLYCLTSPFSYNSGAKFQAFVLPDFTDRETELKEHGSLKTPKRLKPVLTFLEQMIWRHGKCGYKPLRDVACPSKVKMGVSKPMDTSIILELMSEHSSQPRSQALFDASISLDISDQSGIARGLSQAQKRAKHKPRFAEFACSHLEVYRYAVLVTKAVIPHKFWGCEKNFKLVLEYVKEFISCRRYETVTLHHVLQGFSVAECEWLMPVGGAALQQTRVCVSDTLKRRELLEEFIFWYFDSFLLQLLKTSFYVTESSAFRNHVLYFRQDDWGTLCEPLIDRLASETFQKMDQHEAQEILRQRRLGFSFVRLLPKDTGVRPIVNLRRKNPQNKGLYIRPEQSINQVLQAAFQILTYEKNMQPSLLGASVFGPNEVYSRLKAFKARLNVASPSGKFPRLYFVKVDVQACFDTIEQTKLLEILRQLITEDAYMIQRYGRVSSAAGKVRRTYVKTAISEDEHPHFMTLAGRLADVLRHNIFVDQVVYPFSKRQEIMELLEEHITENIVKIGHDYYRQMVGIPQGSVLSTLLCSFFYGDLDRRHFKFAEDPQSILLRLIDDYLLITTSATKARHFLDMMSKGHPEYGCLISKEKTLTNFDYDAQIMNVTEPQQQGFPWCGYLIDMKDLSVSADYTRYHETYLEDSLTVEKGRRPGVAFTYKMLQLAKHKSHSIFCDTDLNSERTVNLNIYQNFLIAAMKMHHYIRSWGVNVHQSTKFFRNVIKQLIHFSYATIRNKASNKMAKAVDGKCEVYKSAVVFLGKHAFHTVLSRKPYVYPQLIKSLAFDLSLPQNRRLRKQYRSLVVEGLSIVTMLSF